MDKKFLNVLLLGFGFMFLFTAFQTMGNIEVGNSKQANSKKELTRNLIINTAARFFFSSCHFCMTSNPNYS